MAKQKFINARPTTNTSMDFDLLLREGVMLAQKFSGHKWTDYNYHDPGFTMLEQLCYALTDLAYRTSFSLEDILLSNKDAFNLEESNLFLPIHKIIPSSPITTIDFSKLILDFSSDIKNVFVKPVFNNAMGLHGLYDIFIQFDDNVSQSQSNSILAKLKVFLHANRTLCTDFNKIKALQRELITIDARINIDPFTLGETVLAHLYNEVNQLLNSNINFYSFEEMLQRGYDVNTIYSGPLLNNGFIDEDEFKPKTNEIYVSNIVEIIENIEGVNSIEFFEVYKNGIKQLDNLIDFKEENYPAFDIQIENYDLSSEKVVLYRNDNIYEIDRVILSQLYHSFSLSAKSNFKSVVSKGINTTPGRFSKKELEEFYSIQNELPAVYGLRKNELPSGSTPKRRGQVNQLKAYLGFFEQIIADHLSQLANVRNLFSVEKDIKNTYFHQYPSDIPDFNLLTPFETKEEYLDFLSLTSESSHSFLERRNRAVDHLMARFSEVFDDSILVKLLMSIDEEKTDEEVKKEVLNLKLDYAKNILSIGKNKSLGFNYKANSGTVDSKNTSGLQARLNLMFGIKTNLDNSLVAPLFDSYKKVKKVGVEWKEEAIAIKNGVKIKVKAAPQKEYDSNEFLFCLDSKEALKQTFLYATQNKSYRVVDSSTKKETKFNVLYNAPGFEQPIKLFESNSESDCYKNIKVVKSRFKELNEKCEGFYLLEHILLRPSMISEYKSLVYAANGSIGMTSMADDSFEKLKSDCEDLMVLGSNPDNYEVVKNEGKDSYQAHLKDLFGNALFKLTEEFDTTAKAKQQIIKWSNYLIKQKTRGVLSGDFTEIKINENLSGEFPDDFKYSNKVSFIFPDWPARFQNLEFKRFINSAIDNYIPANLTYDVFFIDINQLNLFEERYNQWLGAKTSTDAAQVDESSLQLIQLLNSYNAVL